MERDVKTYPPSQEELLEPCCEHCRADIEREPDKALLIKEKCLFETRLTDDTGGGLSWD